ncbi:MAG: hypothetical protein QXG99_00565, partial [Conexivisphaerales archaeon]
EVPAQGSLHAAREGAGWLCIHDQDKGAGVRPRFLWILPAPRIAVLYAQDKEGRAVVHEVRLKERKEVGKGR